MQEKFYMAEQVCHQQSNQPRVDIDTTLPFRSVRAAVCLFDEKAEVKKFRLPEGIKELELNQLKEELANVKRQLRDTEDAKANVFAELSDSKKLLVGMTKGMGKPCSSVPAKRQERNAEPLNDEEVDRRVKENNLHIEAQQHSVWEVELKVAQQQHITTMAELEMSKKNLEKIQQELVSLLNGRENPLKQTEEAMTSAEINARTVEELSNEISGTKESLSLVKLACMEVSKERANFSEMRGDADFMINVQTTTVWEQDIEDLEIKLAVATEELMKLRQGFVTAQEAEAKVARDACQAFSNLDHAKSILEKTQLLESAGISSSAFFSNLDIAKRELEKALETGASLQATMNGLQSELDSMKRELANLREREENASAAVETLTRELRRTKNKLKATVLPDVEVVSGLSQNLHQSVLEADTAKDNEQTLKQPAGTAKTNTDQVKALMTSAQHRLETALKGAEMAKANESAALQRFKDLFEKVSAARAVGIEVEIGTTEFQGACDTSMEQELWGVEKFANTGFGAQVIESMKASKLHGQDVHETYIDCVDIMKRDARHCYSDQKGGMEGAETIDVETVTRWREGELIQSSWVAEREAILVTTQKEYQCLEMGGDAQPGESLAHFMYHKEMLQKKKKKQHLLASLNSFLGRKNQIAINLVEN